MKRNAVFFLFIGITHQHLAAQSAPPPVNVPSVSPPVAKTQLEKFTAKSGSVVIWGFSEVDEVEGVQIQMDEYTDAADNSKSRGIRITVTDDEASEISFVDEDEIDSLIAGIEYIKKATKSVTSLSNFEASYRTRGDLKITVFSRKDGSLSVAVQAGEIRYARKFISLVSLSILEDIIKTAQGRLKALK